MKSLPVVMIGSGKTYTMEGPDDEVYTLEKHLLMSSVFLLTYVHLSSQLGVVPRVIAQLFSQLEDSVISGTILHYDSTVSFLQIYNEQVCIRKK